MEKYSRFECFDSSKVSHFVKFVHCAYFKKINKCSRKSFQVLYKDDDDARASNR